MKVDTFQDKNERNARVQSRYDELMQAGAHGHYETMFRIVREEIERDRAGAPLEWTAIDLGMVEGTKCS